MKEFGRQFEAFHWRWKVKGQARTQNEEGKDPAPELVMFTHHDDLIDRACASGAAGKSSSSQYSFHLTPYSCRGGYPFSAILES